jgi:membrane-associated phospholipid phosphatase
MTRTWLALALMLGLLPRSASAQEIDPRVLAAAAIGATAYFTLEAADHAGRDHLAWSPAARPIADWASYGTVAAGIGLSCAQDQTRRCYTRAGLRIGATVAIAETVKRLVHRERPDQSDRKSFFSEHTALACVGGFSSRRELMAAALCASTAYLRVGAKRHWVTDVAAGAAVGFGLSRIGR